MVLTKEEWKTYKKRNIDRILDVWFVNQGLAHTYLANTIDKHPRFAQFIRKLLNKKLKLDFRMYKKASYPNLDFQITTKCTLNCDQCCSLMPFYNADTHHSETFETFKENLDNLLKNVHNIYRLQIIGGEPFLNKDIHKMLRYASKKRQIKYICTITNGTIIPSNEVINVYKRFKHKNFIRISDYRDNQELKQLKTAQVYELIKANGISVHLDKYKWIKRGCIKKEDRTNEQLKAVFNSCWQINCPSYCDGELHMCSRSVGIKRNVDNSIKDYVKIDSHNNCANEIIQMFIKEYIDACDYCHTEPNTEIPMAVQAKSRS